MRRLTAALLALVLLACLIGWLARSSTSDLRLVQPPAPSRPAASGTGIGAAASSSAPAPRTSGPTSPRPAPEPPAGPDWRTGVSPGGSILDGSDAQLDSDVRAIAATGVGWVRLDLSWEAAEPERGRYAWRAFDRAADAARRHRLQVLAVIGYSPAWARPAGTGTATPPVEPTDMARFASAAGARFGRTVAAWEVWNEPNLAERWHPRPDPAGYARLLRAVSAALRAADPGSPVLSGGLAPARTGSGEIAPADFLTGLYQHGAGDAFDAVAVHPYSYPALAGDTRTVRWNTFQRLPLLRQVLLRHGDAGTQVWLTEFGAPTGTGTDAVSPARQAQILASGFAQARRWPWIGALFSYSLRDSGTDRADREQNFGVLAANGSPKPAWATLVEQAALSRGSR